MAHTHTRKHAYLRVCVSVHARATYFPTIIPKLFSGDEDVLKVFWK